MSQALKPSTGHHSSTRTLAFRVLAIVLAAVPFLAAECYLRFRSLQSSASDRDDGQFSQMQDPLFDTQQLTPLFEKSSDGLRWQIPKTRYDFFRPASFPVVKPDDTRRVFVLGGSTVQGRPYETETSMSAWVQLQLQSIDLDTQYEIINCGGVSYASYRLAIILEELLQLQPDAIVLYTGHNEFLEERSYRMLEQTALDRFANRSRLVDAFRSFFRPTPSVKNSFKDQLSADVQTRLDLEKGLQRYQRASQNVQWRDAVVAHFGERLQHMVLACKHANTPLVLCMPASDLVNTPPIKVSPAELTADQAAVFDTHWIEARDASLSSVERLDACGKCLEVDPEHAGACYIAGMLAWQSNDEALASSFLQRARDADVCPLRATTAVLGQIQAIADRNSIELVRCEQLLDQTDSLGRALPDGIPDPGRFVDHVHPTIKGHQVIGREIARRLAVLFGITPVQFNSGDAESAYESAVRQHLALLGEDYHARAKQRLKGLQEWAAGRAGKMKVGELVAPISSP